MGEGVSSSRRHPGRVPRRTFGSLGAANEEAKLSSFPVEPEDKNIPESADEEGRNRDDFWEEQRPPHY